MSENGSSNGNSSESPLTQPEVDAITESWKLIWADKKNNAPLFFIKLFTHRPETIERFNDFKGLTVEEISVHKKLKAHGLSVFYAIKSLVDNLDDLETLVELITKNAKNHVSRGVTGETVKWLVPVFVELMNDKLPGKVTELHITAWGKVFDVMASIQDQECAKCKT